MEYVSTLALLAGGAIGLARGGSLARLLELRLRYSWLVAVGFGVQIALLATSLEVRAGDAVGPLLLITNLLVLTFVALNVRIPGLKLIGLGLLLNTVVMALNGGYMPVSARSLESAGMADRVAEFAARGHVDKSRLIDEQTRLGFLADVLTVSAAHKVFSFGDILIGLGAFWLVAAGMRPGGTTTRGARTIAPPDLGGERESGRPDAAMY
jgi:hypothetical protein